MYVFIKVINLRRPVGNTRSVPTERPAAIFHCSQFIFSDRVGEEAVKCCYNPFCEIHKSTFSTAVEVRQRLPYYIDVVYTITFKIRPSLFSCRTRRWCVGTQIRYYFTVFSNIIFASSTESVVSQFVMCVSSVEIHSLID